MVVRARRLERFLTQPFFTTEQFTGIPGKLVSLADALDGCERILGDEFKDWPESALYMIGAISEAKTAKATKSNKDPATADMSDKPETPDKTDNVGEAEAKPDAAPSDAQPAAAVAAAAPPEVAHAP